MSQRITVQDGGVFYAIPEGPGLVQPQPGSDLTGITFGIDGQINVVQANVGPPSTPGFITTPAGSTSNLIITTGVAIGPIVDFGNLIGGSAYIDGIYNGVPLTGGSGSGATANITVSSGGVFTFGIISGGTLYTNGTYLSVPLTGGSGVNATANITVLGNSVTSVVLVDNGYGYLIGDILSATPLTGVFSTTGNGVGFSIPVASITNTISSVVLVSGGVGYDVGDTVFSYPSIVTFGTVIPGSGYTDGLYTNVPLINISGSGVDAVANITVFLGSVTSVVLVSGGLGYRIGDVLSATPLTGVFSTTGNGSGFMIPIATTTGTGFNIAVSKTAGGNLILDPYGAILLNGTAWPMNSTSPGNFLATTSVNTLEFLPLFVYNGSDTLTTLQLNTDYPDAQAGQTVLGTTVVYLCIGSGVWYKLGGGGGGGAVSSFQTSLSGLFPTSATTGAITLSGVLGIGSGGTGQTSKDTAFDALSPTTSIGDMIFYNGFHNVALPIGTPGQVLTVAGGMPQWNTSSVTLASNLAGGAANEIPFQSAVNVTTFSPRFTWQDGLAILGLGSTTGHVYITATEVGGTITIGTSDSVVNIEMTDSSGITFTTGGTEFIIGPLGDWTLNATPGTAGQVLTSQGGGLSPIWQIPHGSNVSAYFDYLSVYPQLVAVVPPGTLVIGVEVIILNPPFLSGVTFSVGSSPSYNDLAVSGDSDPQTSGTYTVGTSQFYLSSTNIYIQSTGTPPATQGSGYVVITTA